LWKGVTVLVVEDHEDTRELFRRILESVGVRALVARHGHEALGLLGQRLDLVLCDLRMPVMDGFAFLRAMRGDPSVSRVPVVAVTAHGADRDLDATWRAGFDGHLTKPIDYDSLVAVLERALGARWKAPDEEDEPG
jgi:two-component system CheB/CheR fusion protein